MTLPEGWHVIGVKADGTALAEDGEGNMFQGTLRRASWDELERTVEIISEEEINVQYKIGNYLHSKSSLNFVAYQNDPDVPEGEKIAHGTLELFIGEYIPQKKHISYIDPEGNPVTVEMTIPVYEWAAL